MNKKEWFDHFISRFGLVKIVGFVKNFNTLNGLITCPCQFLSWVCFNCRYAKTIKGYVVSVCVESGEWDNLLKSSKEAVIEYIKFKFNNL